MNNEKLLARSHEGLWQLIQKTWSGQTISLKKKYEILLRWAQEDSFQAGYSILRNANIISSPIMLKNRKQYDYKEENYQFGLDKDVLTFAITHKNAVLLNLLSRALDEYVASKDNEQKNEMLQSEKKLQSVLTRNNRRWQLAKRISKYRNQTNKEHRSINYVYLATLLVTFMVIAILLHYGLAQKATVNIEFNVGDIIAGLLVGTGALFAGVAYANRRPGRVND